VGFQITTVPGIKNMIFGGDGIFLAVLQGPGTVWLQTLPSRDWRTRSPSICREPRTGKREGRLAARLLAGL